MADLLSQKQVEQIRDVFHDLSETFAFPITIQKKIFSNSAFRTDPGIQSFEFNAIREFFSQNQTDQFRNDLGPAPSHEFKIYIHWRDLEDASLIDSDNKILLGHNDTLLMEGEIYEIISFGGIALMSKKPSFGYLLIKRKWTAGSE